MKMKKNSLSQVHRKEILLGVALISIVFLLNFISAELFQFDNTVQYSAEDMKATIKNTFGIGVEFGSLELKSHKTLTEIRHVFLGENVPVMYYDFSGWKDIYKNGLGEVEFTDVRTGKKLDRDYYFAKAIYRIEQIPDYKEVCELKDDGVNKTLQNVCRQELKGYVPTERFVKWERLDSRDILKEPTRIALMTDVKDGDWIDGIWTIAGKKISKHAEWTSDLNNNLIAYYQMNETTGSNEIIDAIAAANNGNATNAVSSSLWGMYGNSMKFDGTGDYINITTIRFNTFKNLSMCGWINVSSGAIDKGVFGEKDGSYSVGFTFTGSGDGRLRFFISGNGGFPATSVVASILPIPLNQNVMVCGIWNGTQNMFFINDTYQGSGNFTGTIYDSSKMFFGRTYSDSGNEDFEGYLDEWGIWNDSLVVNNDYSKITQLYNEKLGLTYLPGEEVGTAVVTLNLPDDGSSHNSNITFNASATPTNVNITNMTLWIWNSTGIFNNTEDKSYDGQNATKNETWYIAQFFAGNYKWNVKACYKETTGDTFVNCTFAAANRTFSWMPFIVDDEAHENSSLETSEQIFRINISSTAGYTVSNGRLVYNGTIYSNADKIQIDANSYQLTKTIFVPQGVAGFGIENRTFYWNISLTEEISGDTSSFLTNIYNQSVLELKFQACNINVNITVLNFTLFDESTEKIINATDNATTFLAHFDVGSHSGNKIKNYSISNMSTSNSTFIFCTNNESRIIYTDMNAIISAVDYSERNYYLTNATLTNASSEILIYLIPNSDSLEFFITITQNLRAVEDADVQVAKYFVGEGVYKTIEIDKTDSNGKFNAYLDLDRNYKVTVIKDGKIGRAHV